MGGLSIVLRAVRNSNRASLIKGVLEHATAAAGSRDNLIALLRSYNASEYAWHDAWMNGWLDG